MCIRDRKETVFSYYDEWAERGIVPEFDLTDTPVWIMGNGQALRRIIQNIGISWLITCNIIRYKVLTRSLRFVKKYCLIFVGCMSHFLIVYIFEHIEGKTTEKG